MSNRSDEARTRLINARDAFIAQNDHAGEAATELLLGFTDAMGDDSVTADSHLERAASLFTAEDERFGAWMALLTLARSTTSSGRPRDAIALHERALQMLDAAADPQSRFSITTVEVFGIVLGLPPEHVQSIVANLELTKTLRIFLAEVVSRAAYGQTLLAAGEVEAAEDQLAQATATGAMFGNILDGMLATPMGDLRKKQWRFDEARQYYETALNLGVTPMASMTSHGGSLEIDVLAKLAEIDVLTGHVEEALTRNDLELTLARVSEPAREPWILIERGSLLQKAGRYPEAEKVYAEAFGIAEARRDLHCIGAIHAELGLLHYYAANYGKAAVSLAKAIEIFQQLKVGKAEAMLWITLADVHLAIDARVSAAEAIAHAKELAKTSQFPMAGTFAEFLDTALKWRDGERVDLRSAFTALMADRDAQGWLTSDEAKRFMTDIVTMNVGMTAPNTALIVGEGLDLLPAMARMMSGVPLAASGDYAGAREIWSKAKNSFQSHDIQAVFEGLIASTYWREGNIGDAIGHFTNARELLETVATDLVVSEMLASYLSARHNLYEYLVEAFLRDGCIHEAFEETERARARAFLQMIGNRRIGARGGDPELINKADIQRRQINMMEQSMRQAGSDDEAALSKHELVAARREYEALMIRVKISNPDYAALTTVDTLPATVIQSQLPKQTTLIDYFVTRSAVHAWIIDRETLDHVQLPIDANALRRITCWARHFNPTGDAINFRGVTIPNGTCAAATADEAYAMLIAPLRSKIRHPRLLIVPHRELH